MKKNHFHSTMMLIIFMDLQCQNHYLPVDGFEWIKDLSKINEDFIKNYDENSDKGYILEVDVEYPKNLQKACMQFV